MSGSLPSLPTGFEYRLDLSRHVTPRLLRDQAIHRWFYFPHSFSPQLVHILLEKWDVPSGAWVLDPFVGAGTTLLAAREKGINALGIDLSPLSIFVSRAKTRQYDSTEICKGLEYVEKAMREERMVAIDRPSRLQRAFTDAEYAMLARIRQAIAELAQSSRDFLLLALLRTQRQFSRAVPDGGWFRWRELPSSEQAIWPTFRRTVEEMLGDLADTRPYKGLWTAIRHDARALTSLATRHPFLLSGCQAIITSPPYPNRHDYSRIFQIELLTLGLQEQDIFALRHHSLRSNVEARAPEYALPPFDSPPQLIETLNRLPEDADRRIEPMLRGYFEDMNAVLYATYQALSPGGHLALVVGNVRHAGVMVPVDVILLEMGMRLGYRPETSWVARLRGNSAQQMGRYGRIPARESVVILRKGDH
ncbi:MAG: hypothetical protein GXP42_17505 [Chloroflexi bacterium]|nr:hypothetical protein [Chloroflexota bacterium]